MHASTKSSDGDATASTSACFSILPSPRPPSPSVDTPSAPRDSHADAEYARLGILRLPRRPELRTPHYLGVSSRGFVPHLAPDVLQDNTSIPGVYAAFEDFKFLKDMRGIEIRCDTLQYELIGALRRTVAERLPLPLPAATCPTPRPSDSTTSSPAHHSPLRCFTALPDPSILALGLRRMPPVPTPPTNVASHVTISTAVGFRSIDVQTYFALAVSMRPDMLIAAVDIEWPRRARRTSNSAGPTTQDAEPRNTPPTLGRRRRERMDSRSQSWLRNLLDTLSSEPSDDVQPDMTLWAPILTLEPEEQRGYLDLMQERAGQIDGLVLYDDAGLLAIPESLSALPRLALTTPSSPQQLLASIARGVDILTAPFVTDASESGIVLNFHFAPSKEASDLATAPSAPDMNEQPTGEPLPLGYDATLPEYATDLRPPVPGCECMTCTQHHRAYLRHLLNAGEMLAWVLLQVHNYHVLDAFFAGVRASLARGTFARDTAAFRRVYVDSLPASQGQGPRTRAYQQATGPQRAQTKPSSYRKLDRMPPNDNAVVAESTVDPVTATDDPTPAPAATTFTFTQGV